MENQRQVFEKRRQKAVYGIRIKRPCSKCDLIEWKHGVPDYWYCPLFEQNLFDLNNMPCDLGEKDMIEACGDCNRLVQNFMRIPEAQEGE